MRRSGIFIVVSSSVSYTFKIHFRSKTGNNKTHFLFYKCLKITYQGTESCVQYFTTNKCWNDRDCSATIKYICQKPPRMFCVLCIIYCTS